MSEGVVAEVRVLVATWLPHLYQWQYVRHPLILCPGKPELLGRFWFGRVCLNCSATLTTCANVSASIISSCTVLPTSRSVTGTGVQRRGGLAPSLSLGCVTIKAQSALRWKSLLAHGAPHRLRLSLLPNPCIDSMLLQTLTRFPKRAKPLDTSTPNASRRESFKSIFGRVRCCEEVHITNLQDPECRDDVF